MVEPKSAWQEHKDRQAANVVKRAIMRHRNERDREQELAMMRKEVEVTDVVSPFQGIKDRIEAKLAKDRVATGFRVKSGWGHYFREKARNIFAKY